MKREARVALRDLERAIDYLDGLRTILERLDEERRGRAGGDVLVAELEALDSLGVCWEPVRYQEDAGTGWAFLADNVTALRERLVERYGEAAL